MARVAVAPAAVGARTPLAMLLAIVLLAACASMGHVTPPAVSVVGVAFDRLDGSDAYFAIAVRLHNPNARVLAVDRLDATLALEDEEVARAALAAPLSLPASGDADATLSARVRMDAVLRVAAKAMRPGAVPTPRGWPALRYSVSGAAVVSGMRLPFARSGELGSASASP